MGGSTGETPPSAIPFWIRSVPADRWRGCSYMILSICADAFAGPHHLALHELGYFGLDDEVEVAPR